MSDVKPIAPVRIGQTDILYAQGIRAGSWLFFTGHEATDFEHGIAAPVTGKPGQPLGGAPRYLREGRFIFDRFAKLIAAEGGDLRHIVRVDQYYPRAECVNPYQRARKTLLKDYVPPSTSVLMEELLAVGANMNVSLLAVLPGEGREPHAARVEGVPVPQHSGFIASLACGDYVFVAGQMPNNEAMTGLDPKAYRPPNAVWNGTDIRLQTEFLIAGRLKPGLEAGGSSLKNAIKAQVYLTDINDLPEFMDVWNGHFADSPCALTVVATKGLALLESKIEINIFGVRDAGKIKKQIIEHNASAHMRLGPAAVRAGVHSAARAHSSSWPRVYRSRKSRSCSPRANSTCIMPSASAPSVPGRIGIHSASVLRIASVRCGSMATMRAPRRAAASRRCMSSGGESVAGFVPQMTRRSACSMSVNMLTSIRPIVTCGAIIAKET